MSDKPPTEDLLDLYENAPCGYVSLSANARIVKVNRTLSDWLRRSPEELMDQSIHDLLSFGGRIAFETHLAPLLRLKGRVDELALDLIDVDGAKLPVIANATERRDAEGQHLFTRLTIFKAVDRRTYERGLLGARDRAESAINSEHETAMLREQFIAVLGHDLRNPLAALAAGVRMLGEREKLSVRGQAILSEMNGSIKRATDLVSNVLDFARGRLGSGLALDDLSANELNPILEQVVSEIRLAHPDRAIFADISAKQAVECDPVRIAQLASNLLSNAVTHGAPGMPIEVEARTENGQFTLSVTNGGMPIPPEAREQLFKPFFRGTVRQSQQGLGLGLFIVHEIAKAHGGEMDVTSQDQVTRFEFTMPVRNTF